LRILFTGRDKTGRLDLEAVEMAIRSAMHHAGATALTELFNLQSQTPISGPFLALAAAGWLPRIT
jgi:hypothetical protein